MKDFLILGNGSAASTVVCFQLFKDNKIWFGPSISSGYRYFEVPDDYEFYGTVYKEEEGKRYIAVSGVRWFTNMNCKRPGFLQLSNKYDKDKYKKFDNYDAININRTEDIPNDYSGLMGVPITFIDKWNPNQFDIVGLFADKRCDDEIFIKGVPTYIDERHKKFVGPVIDCKALYERILIKKRSIN